MSSSRKPRVIRAADLFAGAGGTSTGLHAACSEIGAQLKLVAVNHWDVAISTHSSNHPYAQHYCQNLDSVDPKKVIPGGKLDILVASPECIHFSNARGGKPVNDQSRASCWIIPRWIDAVSPDIIVIENVQEFLKYGPLNSKGRPIKRRQGEGFITFIKALEALGYRVEYRVLNCANYGDPTTRERLFIIAVRGRRKIVWPEPTHAPVAKSPQETLFGKRQPWRVAREIIDWTIPGKSIFARKKPLKPNTLKRIFAGLQKYCGLPFIVPNFGEREGQQPRTHSLDNPLPAVTGHGAGALVQPFIVELRNNLDSRSIDEPLSTITAGGSHHALCEPFILPQQSGGAPRSVEQPLPTIAGAGAISMVEPFIVPLNHGKEDIRSYSLERPLPTITSFDAWGLVEPFLLKYHGDHENREDSLNRAYSLDEPLRTIDTSNRYALVEPFLIKYNSSGGPLSLDEPLDTISTRDRFGLVIPQLGAVLDIRFRMLQPHELARAMSFPDDYKFSGTREQQVKQIGNAVPVNTSKALCKALLESAS